jgi:SPX domain protein involved in polyphosphate accumulation
VRAERVVHDLVEEYESTSTHENGNDVVHSLTDLEDVLEDSDDDESVDRYQSVSTLAGSTVAERFRSLEEEVATLVADVHDLALYTKLNFTGFIKIVKVSLDIPLRLLSHTSLTYPEARCTHFTGHSHFT